MERTSEKDIEQWLLDLKNGIATDNCKGPSFLRPYIFVTLATELKRHAKNDLTMQGDLKTYAARMGLWDAIDAIAPCAVFKKNENGRFLPIQKIFSESSVNDIAIKLIKILTPICIDTKMVKGIGGVLSELLENCFFHAKSSLGTHGLVCCQPWPKAKLLQIAICDGGIGIRNSLSNNPVLKEKLANYNSCEIATEYQITGNPPPAGRNTGYGLTVARRLLEQNLGNLIIISHSEFFRSYNGSISRGTLSTGWQGTLLILEFNTDKEIDCKAIYNSLPIPEGFNDDDFNL